MGQCFVVFGYAGRLTDLSRSTLTIYFDFDTLSISLDLLSLGLTFYSDGAVMAPKTAAYYNPPLFSGMRAL